MGLFVGLGHEARDSSCCCCCLVAPGTWVRPRSAPLRGYTRGRGHGRSTDRSGYCSAGRVLRSRGILAMGWSVVVGVERRIGRVWLQERGSVAPSDGSGRQEAPTFQVGPWAHSSLTRAANPLWPAPAKMPGVASPQCCSFLQGSSVVSPASRPILNSPGCTARHPLPLQSGKRGLSSGRAPLRFLDRAVLPTGASRSQADTADRSGQHPALEQGSSDCGSRDPTSSRRPACESPRRFSFRQQARLGIAWQTAARVWRECRQRNIADSGCPGTN